MTLTFRTLFPMVLSALLFVSCGSDSEGKVRSSPVTNAPQNAEGEEEHGGNRTIRYDTIVLEENCGFWTDCDFTIRSDFNQRPVILTAEFVDNGFPTDDSTDEGRCHFQATLTETEADILEGYADKIRFCEVENLPSADRGFDGLFATDTSGREYMAYKYKDGGQAEEGKIQYLCGGRLGYYNYMKKIILSRAPISCPSGYKRLFR